MWSFGRDCAVSRGGNAGDFREYWESVSEKMSRQCASGAPTAPKLIAQGTALGNRPNSDRAEGPQLVCHKGFGLSALPSQRTNPARWAGLSTLAPLAAGGELVEPRSRSRPVSFTHPQPSCNRELLRSRQRSKNQETRAIPPLTPGVIGLSRTIEARLFTNPPTFLFH